MHTRTLNKTWNFCVAFLFISMQLFGAVPAVVAAPSPTGATIASDLADYPPGATVTITGAGWAAGEAVHIFVNDDASQSWKLDSNPDPVAAADGSFVFQFQLPTWFVANYSVTATGPVSGVATTAFTDLSIGTYDQCSNDQGTGYASGDTGCRWINGNLQSNNSIYMEGDATVQRVWLTGFVPGTSHSLTLKYGTTKGGKHAYDFLTRWDWSEDWVTVADRCQGITGCEAVSENSLAIPVDPNAGGFDVAANVIKPRQFIMRGGTLNSATTPAVVSGSYTSDSETVITVNFTVSSSGSMCPTQGSDAGTCGVALWFGAHVAAQANWGLGLGAGSISGSPYHVALDAVDNASVGQRDNQMQANVVTFIPNGTIIIIKDAVPNDAQDFSFDLHNNPQTIDQTFSLDDDSDPTLPNSKTFSVPPGTWIATETSIPSGWLLTNLTCVDPSNNTSVSGAAATINLASNETVTCTYTDTKQQNKDVTVSKTAVASFGRLYKWLIDKSVDQTTINIADGGTATFNYSVKVTPDGYTDSAWAVGGKITVANPNAFAVTGVNVTDSIDNGGSCTVTGGTNVTVPANDKVVLDYSCTYAAAPSPVTGTNTATATWDQAAYYTPSGTASGTAGVDFSKVTPTETNKVITVVDDKTDPANPVTLDPWNWADGEHTFTYALDKQGVAGTCTDYTNTAQIKQTGQSDSQKVTVCVGKDLTLTKTAAGTFDRAYQWQISKDVDKTLVQVAQGGSATFHYTVTVKQTGVMESGWNLSGKITISNPNDWENITLTGLTDTVDNGGTCSLDAGPYTVLAGKTLDVNYTCSYASAPSSLSGTNTIAATWDKTAAYTPNGSASGSAGFTLTQAGAANKTVTVTDTYKGSLGTVTATDASPFTSKDFVYDRTESGVGGTCTTYDNTARITETNQAASQFVKVCVGQDLTVTKTAAGTFNRAYLWDISKAVDQTRINIAQGGTATFKYTVDVTQTGITDAGWMLSGKITINNPNDWEDITLISLSDAVDNGGTCTVAAGPYVIPKSGSLDVDYSCTYASAPSSYSGSNTSTAIWDKAAAFTPTGSAAGSAPFTLAQAGAANKTVTVTDSLGGSLGTVTAKDSAPFASASFQYSHDFAGVGGTCTNYDNTAAIKETGQSASKTVTVCVGKDLTVTKTAAGTFNRSYLWDISKAVDKTTVNIAAGDKATFNYTVDVAQTGISDAGWTLSGKITITNPNDWEDIPLTNLTDMVDNGGTCTVDPVQAVAPRNDELVVGYSCSYTLAPSSYNGTNTATATWDKATYFTPTGSAAGSAPFTLTQLGAANKTIHVTDTLGGDLGTVTATDAAPFASQEFQYSHEFAGVGGTCTTYDNTATITETKQTASKTVTVCAGLDLTVTKTAAGTSGRTYNWAISKNVDQTKVSIADGGSYTFHYTVGVEQTGIVDAGWTLSGKITISNPNDWEDITLTGLSDAVDNGGACTVANGPYVVPKSGSLDVNYSCAYASAPSSYSGTNTATATWDKALAFTPSGTTEGSAPFTLTQAGATNKTVHVTDSYGGDLGTVTATDSAPFAKASFTYDRTESGVAGKCTTYDNTATITETKQTADKTVTLCVAKDLTVSKTAAPTFTRTYLWGISKAVDKTQINIAPDGTATFNYTVNVTHDNGADSAWLVTGQITVSNPNDWEAITVDVTDAVDNGGSCVVPSGKGVIIPASGSQTVDYTCSYASAPSKYNGTNTATATWDKAAAATPNGSASGTAGVAFTPTTIVDGSVTVSDTLGGTLGTVSYTDPSPTKFTYSNTFSGDPAGTCTNHNNTATFTTNTTGTTDSASQAVKVCVGMDLTVTKTAAGTFDRTYLWSISKDVDKTSVSIAEGGSYTFHYTVGVAQTGFTDSGWKLSGVITISNPNDWEDITLTSLSDTVPGGSCTLDSGPYKVLAGKTLDVNYSCTYASAPSSYSGVNSATATWDKALAFTPTGAASGSAPFTLAQAGATNKTVHVTDSYGGNLGTVTATDDAPFAKASFTYDRTESGVAGKCTTYDNTAKITETNQTAAKTVTLCVAKDLTISKTATPTFTRTYLWDITKSVDQNLVRQNGGNVTFNYTVVVTETGFTDSNWKVTGTITVTNPNDWQAITVNVADSVDNGGTCTVTGGTGVSIPASGSKTFNYSCTWASAPSNVNGINTATATWDKAAAFTPSGSVSGTADFSFTSPTTEVNKTITVTDTFNGSTNTLGTVTAVSTTPYTTKTFTYPRTVPVPAAGCKDYPNTAKITETGQTASAKVTVCRPSLVTNSQLCTVPNDQWRLVFTPDVNQSNGYKLNASNPGQTFYNIFYTGAGNEDITLTLPYPYVTQGATPIHVYSNVGVTTSGGITCLTPSGELANQTNQVTLSNYTPQSFGSTYQVTVHVPAVSGGFAYINIHLDYGLKGTTGYLKGGPSGNDAVYKTNTAIVKVPDLQKYAFSDTAGGSYTVSTTNAFKKNPGIGGKGSKKLSDDPVAANTKVVITDVNKKTVATLYTDEDGWFMWAFKYTGKATIYNITMAGITQSVTLKANGYVEVDFVVP